MYSSKDIVSKKKTKSKKQEKTATKHISDKELVFRIYKQAARIDNKKSRDLDTYIAQEDGGTPN